MAERAFQRVLLKLSGELLGGTGGRGLDGDAAATVCERVREALGLGVQVALVVGAGNLFRGLGASRSGMDRCSADAIGMLATVMNALALREAFALQGIEAEVQSAIPVAGMVDPFDHRRACSLLDAGRVVLFAGGTGHPFFTTDTTAALRACQIGAGVLLKGTKVDGIYDSDPVRNPAARRYARLSYAEALVRQLGIMDSAAFSLCQENRLPILVFRFGVPGELGRLMVGDFRSATLVSAES